MIVTDRAAILFCSASCQLRLAHGAISAGLQYIILGLTVLNASCSRVQEELGYAWHVQELRKRWHERVVVSRRGQCLGPVRREND